MGWPRKSLPLIGGPQDGAKVKPVGGSIPEVIFVGSECKGDGFAAYGREWCDRFTHQYVLDGYKFKYRGKYALD